MGPYDALSGRLKGVPWERCVLHSRHYYDPPEMVTVLEAVGDSTNGFHVGYFRYMYMYKGDIHVYMCIACSYRCP